MTKSEIVEALEFLPDDTELRFALQPGWPFEYSIDSVAVMVDPKIIKSLIKEKEQELLTYANERATDSAKDKVDYIQISDDGDGIDMYDSDGEYLDGRVFDWWGPLAHDEIEKVVYLSEGSQLGYLPGNVKSELGW